MATVYRGRHSTLNREVAIKVLHPHLSSSPRNRMRFAREAKAVERLRHENILEIFDYSGQEASDCYIVTEFVEGETLSALLKRHGRLPSEVVAQIGIRIARALSFAHHEGILHRDLKTDNIMVRVDGTLKLMDFGIARFLDESQVTMTGALVGSPAFMSPEQAREGPLDQRSDLFSFGTVLYYLVSGHMPFAGSNPSVILKNVIEGNRVNVAELAPSMSASIADIVERLLSLSPEDRFNTADEVESALAECLHEVRIDPGDRAWSVLTFLGDPEAYERKLDAHLGVVLLEEGRRLLDVGDHLAALRMFNRLLSMDEENEEVLTLVQSLHGAIGSSHRVGAWIASGALLTVVLALGGLWMVSSRPAEMRTEGPRAELLRVEAPDGTIPVPTQPPMSPIAVSPPAPERAGGKEPSEATAPAPRAAAVEGGVASSPSAGSEVADGGVERAPRRAVTIRRTQEADPEPEIEHGWVVINANGRSAEVYARGSRMGLTSEAIKLPVGSHDLEARSKYFFTHAERDVVVAPGERRVLMVDLEVRPAAVVFPTEWEAACEVRLTDGAKQGERMGSIGSLGRRVRIERPDGRVRVEVACPDGVRGAREWSYMTGDENPFPAPSASGGPDAQGGPGAAGAASGTGTAEP